MSRLQAICDLPESEYIVPGNGERLEGGVPTSEHNSMMTVTVFQAGSPSLEPRG
jgi:hypothetical protein